MPHCFTGNSSSKTGPPFTLNGEYRWAAGKSQQIWEKHPENHEKILGKHGKLPKLRAEMELFFLFTSLLMKTSNCITREISEFSLSNLNRVWIRGADYQICICPLVWWWNPRFKWGTSSMMGSSQSFLNQVGNGGILPGPWEFLMIEIRSIIYSTFLVMPHFWWFIPPVNMVIRGVVYHCYTNIS